MRENVIFGKYISAVIVRILEIPGPNRASLNVKLGLREETICSNMKQRGKEREDKCPEYSKDEFLLVEAEKMFLSPTENGSPCGPGS